MSDRGYARIEVRHFASREQLAAMRIQFGHCGWWRLMYSIAMSSAALNRMYAERRKLRGTRTGR